MNGMKQEKWNDSEVMTILTSADIKLGFMMVKLTITKSTGISVTIVVHRGGMVVKHVARRYIYQV